MTRYEGLLPGQPTTTVVLAPESLTVLLAAQRHTARIDRIAQRKLGHNKESGSARNRSLTMTGAALAAVGAGLPAVLIWPILAIILIDAGLNAYYLWQGRLLRDLQADKTVDVESVESWDVSKYKAHNPYWRALLSPSVLAVHIPLAVLLLVAGVLL